MQSTSPSYGFCLKFTFSYPPSKQHEPPEELLFWGSKDSISRMAKKKKKEKKPSPQLSVTVHPCCHSPSSTWQMSPPACPFCISHRLMVPRRTAEPVFLLNKLFEKKQKKRKKRKETEGKEWGRDIDPLFLFKANYPLQRQFLLSMSCSSSLLITLRG